MGFAAEEQFKSFLKFQKGTFAIAEYPSEELILELASSRHGKKLRTVLKDRGTLSNLKSMGSVHLMDLLFKCDALVEYEDINGEKVTLSVDVTSNLKKVYKKEEIISTPHFKNTLTMLGVDRTLIVVWQVEGFANITRAQTYSLAGKILDQLDSNNHFVNTIVLTNEDLEQ